MHDKRLCAALFLVTTGFKMKFDLYNGIEVLRAIPDIDEHTTQADVSDFAL
jgi:hypothetical protein